MLEIKFLIIRNDHFISGNMPYEIVLDSSRNAQLTSMKKFPDISSKIRRSNKPLTDYKQSSFLSYSEVNFFRKKIC